MTVVSGSFSIFLSVFQFLNPLIFHSLSSTIVFSSGFLSPLSLLHLQTGTSHIPPCRNAQTLPSRNAPALKQDTHSFSTSASKSSQCVLRHSSLEKTNPHCIQNWNSALFRSTQDQLPLNLVLPHYSACDSHLKSCFLNKFQDIPFEHFSSAPMQ